MPKIFLTTALFVCALVASPKEISAQALFPVQNGKIVFHRYTDWNAWDGQLFIYDFGERSLDNISANWTTVEHTTNAHFSTDGKKIIFMAVPKGVRTVNGWNIYVWDVGSNAEPKELLPKNGLMDQDPKFFPDGVNAAFKHNGDIGIVNTGTGAFTKLTNQGMADEKSMEYPTRDGNNILYTAGNAPHSRIYSMNIRTQIATPMVITPGVQNYYCIVRDDSTFLYTRWASPTNKGDDIYLANMNTGSIEPLEFNLSGSDDSDPYPANDSLVFFSSNRSGGKGGYDLWVGNMRSGETRSLSLFGVNSSRHDLGVCYTTNSVPLSASPPQSGRSSMDYLGQNFPNPYNPQTTITYSLKRNTHVTLSLYDVLGRERATLIDSEQPGGDHTLLVNSAQYKLPSGMYFYRMQTDDYVQTKSMIVLQ